MCTRNSSNAGTSPTGVGNDPDQGYGEGTVRVKVRVGGRVECMVTGWCWGLVWFGVRVSVMVRVTVWVELEAGLKKGGGLLGLGVMVKVMVRIKLRVRIGS